MMHGVVTNWHAASSKVGSAMNTRVSVIFDSVLLLISFAEFSLSGGASLINKLLCNSIFELSQILPGRLLSSHFAHVAS